MNTREKGHRRKVRRWRVKRSGWIERQWRAQGKRPTCAEGDQDTWKERDVGRTKKWEKEAVVKKEKRKWKIPYLWSCLHLDEIHIYNGASLLNPSGVSTVHGKFQNNATYWNISGTIWDIKQCVHALGNGLVCSLNALVCVCVCFFKLNA